MLQDLSFEVWVEDSGNPCDGVGPFWRPVAAFRYLQESLDFLAYCRKVGVDAVSRSTLFNGKPRAKYYAHDGDVCGAEVTP